MVDDNPAVFTLNTTAINWLCFYWYVGQPPSGHKSSVDAKHSLLKRDLVGRGL